MQTKIDAKASNKAEVEIEAKFDSKKSEPQKATSQNNNSTNEQNTTTQSATIADSESVDNKLADTKTANAKSERIQKIIDTWCENYFDAAKKCIENAFDENNNFQEDELSRLKIFLGPEKYWQHFQVKQKIYHLEWERIKIQSNFDLWSEILYILTHHQNTDSKTLTATKLSTCLSELTAGLKTWAQTKQSHFENGELRLQAQQLIDDGYEADIVLNRFFKPFAKYYQDHLLLIQNEALFSNSAFKKFQTAGDITQAIKTILQIRESHRRRLFIILAETETQKKLISEVAILKIVNDYKIEAIAFIEHDIKVNPNHRINCYYGYTPSGMVREIIQILDPTPDVYLDIKLSDCIDMDGNTLLHHALKKYHQLDTEKEKEAFLKIIEVLYHFGATAHTKNFLGKNAYEYAAIDSAEWCILPGWQLGLLEIEATFVYSEMETGVKNILCEYSRDSQRTLQKGFFSWIVGLFYDWHNLKASDRSRDLNEVLKETLYESLINLDDDILERSIEHQRMRTSRSDKSKLFGRLIDEVLIPLRQSKLFSLKIDVMGNLEFYRNKLLLTEEKVTALEEKGQALSLYSKSLEEKIEKMQQDFTKQINAEITKLKIQLGLAQPRFSTSTTSFSPLMPSIMQDDSLSPTTLSDDDAQVTLGSSSRFFTPQLHMHSEPIWITRRQTDFKIEQVRIVPKIQESALDNHKKEEHKSNNHPHQRQNCNELTMPASTTLASAPSSLALPNNTPNHQWH